MLMDADRSSKRIKIDDSIYINLECFVRVLDTSKREDIQYFKRKATRPEIAYEIKIYQIYINADHEQQAKHERALNQQMQTENKLNIGSVCDS